MMEEKTPMMMKKNPDWYVWVGDVFHWLRTPIGIFVSIIVILVAALIYTNQSKIYPSRIVQPQPTPPQQTQQPTQQQARPPIELNQPQHTPMSPEELDTLHELLRERQAAQSVCASRGLVLSNETGRCVSR